MLVKALWCKVDCIVRRRVFFRKPFLLTFSAQNFRRNLKFVYFQLAALCLSVLYLGSCVVNELAQESERLTLLNLIFFCVYSICEHSLNTTQAGRKLLLILKNVS